jgi:CheY-like chemotaxis protein
MTSPPGLRILIVEDALENAFALQYLLQAHGHVVDIATDADTALAKCRLIRHDAVLCDIELRGPLDGHDIARTLRRQPQRPYLIAYSGYGGPQHLADSREAGFDEHIVKPATPQQILAALHRSR